MHDPYPIPCNRFLAAFSDFVDRELSGARQAEFMAHLDDCEPCLRHLRAYRTGIAAYKSLESDDVPCDFFEMIQTRLAETGGNRPVAVPVAHPRDADPGRTQRLAGFAVAVAAMFVIVLSYGTGPEMLDEGQPLMSIASVIPTITQPSLVPHERRTEPRVRREQPRTTDADVDSWTIAEVEPRFVSAKGRVQNQLNRLPITREPVVFRASINIP
jgi:hypothetical protein